MNPQPWLQNKKWQNNRILSNAKSGMVVLIIFCLVWLAANALLFFNIDQIRAKAESEPMVWIVIIFPISFVWLLFSTYRAVMQWLRIGATPLVLDPFPGSIGGHAGGYIESNIPYKPNLLARVSLHCIYSYLSGSGDDRKRSESVKWQTDGVCHNSHSAKGTQFRFRFDIPADLHETELDSGSSSGSDYHLWRLHLEIDIEGKKVERNYQIPVFKTAEHSVHIHNGTEEHQATIDAAVDGVESIAKLRPITDGIEAWFPAFQRPGQGFAMLFFGLFFIAVGLGIGYSDGPLIFPIVFSLVGGIITLVGIHYLAKSLLVSVTKTGIKARRFLFGVPITTTILDASNIDEFEIKQTSTTQSGQKTTVYYRLYARGKSGKEFPVAERLSSRSEAEVIKESFERHLVTG